VGEVLVILVRILMAFACAAALAPPAQAKLVEEVVAVPVSLRTAYGRSLQRNMVVTVFYDDAKPRPYPVAVIGHGRAGTAQGRVNVARARYEENARWLAQLGFIVAIPTRVGYGETGGEDVETAPGNCDGRDYRPGFAAAADQLQAALAMLRARPDAAQDRGVVMGQSFGGAATVALAARNPPGIQLALNFAGGAGADPVGAPERPCSPAQLQRAFALYGTTARIPTLWLYTENDRSFGQRYPREWFESFRGVGGRGEFVVLPALGDDGHRAFTEAPHSWQPQVLDAMRQLGVLRR
jgi:dienelactone hydrolase